MEYKFADSERCFGIWAPKDIWIQIITMYDLYECYQKYLLYESIIQLFYLNCIILITPIIDYNYYWSNFNFNYVLCMRHAVRFCSLLNHGDIKVDIENNSEHFSSAMLHVFRASNLIFCGEYELDEARTFSRNILKKVVSTGKGDLLQQV